MKTIRLFTTVIIALLFFNTSLNAQDGAPERPMYVTATTMHWNMDKEDFSMKEWIALEKEYLEKVTMKNKLVIGSSYYMHRYTADNRELILVRTFASWADIDKAGERDTELINEAWPDEDARNAFFKNQDSYYAPFHSDEIYETMSGAKVMTEAPGDDMILYVRKRHFASPEDGTNKEFNEMRDEFIENVIHKNELIKGYYPNGHAWGSNKTEYIEAFLFNSMADLDSFGERSGELVEEHWPDEAAREEMNKKGEKYFTGVHGDYIYSLIEELTK
tara:strand:+ start:11549 stop:12373 length:825 start_codon:yes stop_codon:yes gene_type:complete